MNHETWSCSVCSRKNERVYPMFCKECFNKLEKSPPENKDKWHIHTEFEIEGRHNYTITTNPEFSGWNTDSGYEGYGLPKEVASFIVEVLNFLNATSMWENTKFGWKLKKEFQKENELACENDICIIDDIIKEQPFPNIECDCEKCQAMCHAPCCGTPEDMKAIINAGYASRLCLDDWEKDSPIDLHPALKGYEGGLASFAVHSHAGCTFWKNGKCELHDSGLKPSQGKMALHGRSDKECEKIVEYIREKWKTDEAKEIIEFWKKEVKYEE